MGRVTIFTLDGCPICRRAKELLASKAVQFQEISLSESPDYKSLMFLLTNGRTSVPQIFFNDRLIGGAEELDRLEQANQLDQMIQDCLEGPDVDFPPPCRKPKSDEFLKVIPHELQEKWQKDLEAIDAQLGGTKEKPISSLLVMLEAPEEMVIVCTTGPAAATFYVGHGGKKGAQGSQEKSYCQVVLERKETLYIENPLEFPGLERNRDWVKYGYKYYIGAPWVVGEVTGTVVAMEQQPDILKPEHVQVVEALRDQMERDFQQYIDAH